jgi:hypothetical protein
VWQSVDPSLLVLAGAIHYSPARLSPYHYGGLNPLRLRDPDGNDPDDGTSGAGTFKGQSHDEGDPGLAVAMASVVVPFAIPARIL